MEILPIKDDIKDNALIESGIGEEIASTKKRKKQNTNGDGKTKVPRVSAACVFCQRSHMSCGNERPCQRCKDRGIEDQCVNPIPRKKGRKAKYLGQPNQVQMETQNQLLKAMQVPASPHNKVMMNPQLPLSFDDDSVLDFPMNIFNEMFAPVSEMSPYYMSSEVIKSQSEHLKHLLEGKTETNETPSTTSRLEWMISGLEFIRKMVPEQYETALRATLTMRPQMVTIRESLTEEMVVSILQDFEATIAQFKSVFEKVAIPTVIYEKCGIIHFYNQAYTELTGFNGVVPSKLEDFEMYKHISAISLSKHLNTFMAAFLDGITNSIILPVEMLSYGKYIDVIVCITIKRDLLGLPMVIVSHILPVVPCALMENQLASVAQQMAKS